MKDHPSNQELALKKKTSNWLLNIIQFDNN